MKKKTILEMKIAHLTFFEHFLKDNFDSKLSDP